MWPVHSGAGQAGCAVVLEAWAHGDPSVAAWMLELRSKGPGAGVTSRVLRHWGLELRELSGVVTGARGMDATKKACGRQQWSPWEGEEEEMGGL